MIFDYESEWLFEIQPQGVKFLYIKLFFNFYKNLRRLGVNIDLINIEFDFSKYDIIISPSLPFISERTMNKFKLFKGLLIFGPRSGSKTENVQIPKNMPPSLLQNIIPIKINRVESFRENSLLENLTFNQKIYNFSYWKEHSYFDNPNIKILSHFNDYKNTPALLSFENTYYLTFWPSDDFIFDFLQSILKKTNINIWNLPENVRIRENFGLYFVFNFNDFEIITPLIDIPNNLHFILGGIKTNKFSISIYKKK